MQYFNEAICGNCWNRITPKHLNGFYMIRAWCEMRFQYYLKGRKSCVKKCRTHKCPSNYRNFSRATFLFVLLFIYLFIYLFIISICLLFCVCLWAIFECDFYLNNYFFLFDFFRLRHLKCHTSSLKQTLTINNISTIFLLKPMPSNTIQAFNVFERY